MSTKSKVLLFTVLILTAFAFGRYSVPETKKTETTTTETGKKEDSKTSDTDRDKHKTIIRTIIIHPDGTREEKEEITEDSKTSKKSGSSSSSETEKGSTEKTEVVRSSSRTRLSVLGGVTPSLIGTPSLGQTVFGAHVSRNVLGPISVGAFGLSSGVCGVSIGLDF